MNLQELLRLLETRDLEWVAVCDVEKQIALAIGAHTTCVRISKDTLYKQCERHPDIRAIEYSMLSDAICRGLAILEADKPNTVIVCYQHPSDETKRFRAQLKRTENRKEIYVTCFHRTKKRQTRAMLKRGPIIRTHVMD